MINDLADVLAFTQTQSAMPALGRGEGLFREQVASPMYFHSCTEQFLSDFEKLVHYSFSFLLHQRMPVNIEIGF